MSCAKGKLRIGAAWFRHELIMLAWAGCAAFLSLALISYHYTDSSFVHVASAVSPIKNWCGIAGAHCAALMIYFFGVMAACVLSMCAWFVPYMLIMRRSWAQEWERYAAAVCFITMFAAFCHLACVGPSYEMVCGGLVGSFCAQFLVRCFDRVGSFLFIYLIMTASLVVMMRFSYIAFTSKLLQSAYKLIHYLIEKRAVFVALAYARIIISWCIVFPIKKTYAYFGNSHNQSPQEDDISVQGESTYAYAQPPSLSEAVDMHMYTHESDADEDDEEHLDIGFAFQEAATQTQCDDEYEYQEHVAPDTSHAASYAEQDVTDNVRREYTLPSLDIFVGVDDGRGEAVLKKELEQRAHALEEKLQRFGVHGSVVSIKRGPVVTLFEYKPGIDTKLSKILSLEDDLALALQAISIRILAPIPGKPVVGFEVANMHRKDVLFAPIIKSETYRNLQASLPLVLGKNTIGDDVVVDLARMPHLLVAGSTGSGKSVALNAMLISLLCARRPDELKLVLIDPKRLEFASYADIGHLLFPIVTDPRRASPILRWIVQEMEERYEQMAQSGVRSISDYNIQAARQGTTPFSYIVVVIDELADLMMTAARDVEDLITRIAQMARAAGIHLIVATQRPSVDVITGLIKVNFPSRIAFRVTSKIDSRTILDCSGADKLLGRGDMLFLDSSRATLDRVHGAYVSDQEINRTVEHIKAHWPAQYLDISSELSLDNGATADVDEHLYQQIIEYLQEIDEVSISLLQRRFRIGFNRSARIIELLESQGLIMPASGGKTRKIIR